MELHLSSSESWVIVDSHLDSIVDPSQDQQQLWLWVDGWKKVVQYIDCVGRTETPNTVDWSGKVPFRAALTFCTMIIPHKPSLHRTNPPTHWLTTVLHCWPYNSVSHRIAGLCLLLVKCSSFHYKWICGVSSLYVVCLNLFTERCNPRV